MRVRRLLVLLWVVATLALATRLGSSERTKTLVVPAFERAGLDTLAAERAHKLLRKGGHVLAYAAFGLLAWWALEGVRGRAAKAVLVAGALAVVDETLQAVTPERGASVLDVVLDVGAAAVAVAWWSARSRRARPPPADG